MEKIQVRHNFLIDLNYDLLALLCKFLNYENKIEKFQNKNNLKDVIEVYNHYNSFSKKEDVDQKRNNKNPRSTVGTLSEVYDYLKLLFLNLGKTYSPISGNLVKKDNAQDVLGFISKNINKKYFVSVEKQSLKNH